MNTTLCARGEALAAVTTAITFGTPKLQIMHTLQERSTIHSNSYAAAYAVALHSKVGQPPHHCVLCRQVGRMLGKSQQYTNVSLELICTHNNHTILSFGLPFELASAGLVGDWVLYHVKMQRC
jgi:hypothetical protein